MDVELRRDVKSVPKGPQSYGASPKLTVVRVQAYDAAPNALCVSSSIVATADTGTGLCIPSSIGTLTIDNGSMDSDTQEGDTLITSKTTLVRKEDFRALLLGKIIAEAT